MFEIVMGINDFLIQLVKYCNRQDLIFGYLTSIEDQQIIKKIELNPPLKSLDKLYSISRGEEGSKFLLKEDANSNVHVHRPPAVTLNKTPEEFHISTGLR